MLLSYAGSYYGYGRMYYDPTMILALIGLVLTMIASSRVNATFAKYNKVRCMAGLTGAQAAEKVLHMAGIYDVRVEHVPGKLTDHYDPRDKVLRLSDSTYGSTFHLHTGTNYRFAFLIKYHSTHVFFCHNGKTHKAERQKRKDLFHIV